MKNKTLIICCLIVLAGFTYSQSNSDSLYISSQDSISFTEINIPDATPLTAGFNFIYGFAVPHAKEVVNIRGTHPIG
ncbi:MAG: hypothetical protein OQK63_03035, partial [Ignavibacteriaceae bacterium]|nr:hypothetical protein [Ignavibacteriaceae bacterium]